MSKSRSPRAVFGIFLSLLLAHCAAHREIGVGPPEILQLRRVIDGDSIKLQDGRELRLVGIDAPEWDQPGGKEARAFVQAQIGKKSHNQAILEKCTLIENDPYERILGYLSVKGEDLQATMLKLGLAVPMTIPPCGMIRGELYEKLAKEARAHELGIWKHLKAGAITHDEARYHLKEYRGVKGVVKRAHLGQKMLYLNFGDNWKKDFTVVIALEDLARFRARGIDPEKAYLEKSVEVFGYIHKYYGPEIRVFSPDQIELFYLK